MVPVSQRSPDFEQFGQFLRGAAHVYRVRGTRIPVGYGMTDIAGPGNIRECSGIWRKGYNVQYSSNICSQCCCCCCCSRHVLVRGHMYIISCTRGIPTLLYHISPWCFSAAACFSAVLARRELYRGGVFGAGSVNMMASSLESSLGDIFKAPDERILKAVEKAGNRYTVSHPFRAHASRLNKMYFFCRRGSV